MVGAEPGGGIPAVREALEQEYHAVVTEGLGNADLIPVYAATCDERDGMHFLAPDFLLLDVIDPDSGAVLCWEDGLEGELVATHLERECVPLVRFRTRDRIVVKTSPCRCGRTGPRLFCIGRTDDMLIVAGVNVWPSAIADVIGSFRPRTTGALQILLSEPGPKVTPPLRMQIEYGVDRVDVASLKRENESRLRARLGATGISGPMISQACATAAVALAHAAAAVEVEDEGLRLVVLTDRTSNGPHLTYPSPSSPGGTPIAEDWVMDNFRRDPWAGSSMIQTAEAVAAEEKISRQEIDDVTALRYEQYARSLADDRAFQRRYMVPVELPAKRGNKTTLDADVGIHATSRAALAELQPVERGGVITYGSQTHPADGAAGALVASAERARSLGVEGVARILAFCKTRVEKARMPKAPLPA